MRFIHEAGQGEGRLIGLQVERLTGRALRRLPCQLVNLPTCQPITLPNGTLIRDSFDPRSTAIEAASNNSRRSVEEK